MHEADATQSAITTAVTAEQRSAACTMATRCERERARYETTTRYFRWSAGDIRPPKVRTNRNVQRKLWSLFSLRSSFLPRSIIAFPHAYPACLSAYRCAARCSSLSWPSWRWPPWSRLNGSLTSPRVSRINRVHGRSTGTARALAVRAMCCCLLTPRHLAHRTLQARVREECTGNNRNGTERFFTLFYNSLTNQFRADVTYGVGISTYTQYFNYVRAGVRACLLARLLANKLTSCSFGYAAVQNNGTGAIFFNASPSGAAHCELVKPGSANTNSFLLPRNWYRSLPPSRSCSPARVLGLPNTASLSTSRYWRRTGLPPQSGPARRRLTASA